MNNQSIRKMIVSGLLVTLLSPLSATSAEYGERDILYWVAPMDANYRRD